MNHYDMRRLYPFVRIDLAMRIEACGAVPTKYSDHPLVIERDGPNGRERGFTLKRHEKNPSAPLSPIQFNLRTPDNPKPGPLTPGLVDLASRTMWYAANEAGLRYDGVVGLPRAGEPFAEGFAKAAGTHFRRLDKWELGEKRCISGLKAPFPPQVKRVLVIDDVIAHGTSKFEGIDNLEDEGLEVTDVLVLVDREEGGKEELERRGYRLHAVYTMMNLLDLYVEKGRMQPEVRTEVRAYLNLH